MNTEPSRQSESDDVEARFLASIDDTLNDIKRDSILQIAAEIADADPAQSNLPMELAALSVVGVDISNIMIDFLEQLQSGSRQRVNKNLENEYRRLYAEMLNELNQYDQEKAANSKSRFARVRDIARATFNGFGTF